MQTESPWSIKHDPVLADVVHIFAEGIKSVTLSCFQPGSDMAHIVIIVRTPAGNVHQLSVTPGSGGLLKVLERFTDPSRSPREVPAHAG